MCSKDSTPGPKTFLETPDKKSIFVFRDGDMQKYALQESSNQYAQLAMKDIKVSQLSHEIKYSGPSSGIPAFME